jgi:hypothetical protein
MITGALFWKEDAWAACLKVLVDRPRRRTLQGAFGDSYSPTETFL